MNTPLYRRDIRDAFDFVQTSAAGEHFCDKETSHRRGKYPNVGFGISLGNGQRTPGHLRLGKHAGFVDKILNNESFKRIVGFTDCEMS